jgi:hypothetical protein
MRQQLAFLFSTANRVFAARFPIDRCKIRDE